MSLAGRTAVVTGASRGIGRGIAEHLASLGADVVLSARTAEALGDVAGGLDPAHTLAFPADVRSQGEVDALFAAAAERFGGVDVVSHNAGIYPVATIDEMTEEAWDDVLRTNLTSTFFVVKAAGRHMRERGGGRIVLTSSITGSRVGFPGLAHYSATKAGMGGFMRTAALELAADGITINSVEPGTIRTESLNGLGEDKIKIMEANVPAGFLGEPVDIATAVAFLGSAEARFITGQSLVVDGGQTLPEIPLS